MAWNANRTTGKGVRPWLTGSYDHEFLMICIALCIKSQNCSYLIAFVILYYSIKVGGGLSPLLIAPHCYAYATNQCFLCEQ